MSEPVKIRLGRNYGSEAPERFALVDKRDAKRVSKYSWFYNAGYAYSWLGGGVRCNMARFIMGVRPQDKGRVVDHINHNTLDNRRENLRVCSPRQNAASAVRRNGARFRGVQVLYGRHGSVTISARLTSNGIIQHLGLFPTDVQAALAYDKAAKKHFGEFACLNFPDGKAPRDVKPIEANNFKLRKQGERLLGNTVNVTVGLPKEVAKEAIRRAEADERSLAQYLKRLIAAQLAPQPIAQAA